MVLGQLPELIKPIENMPFVLLPAAEPRKDAVLDEPTPHAVLLQVAYVYLFRITFEPPGFEYPNANIPLVLFPAAAPYPVVALDTATQAAVLLQVEYVYLLRILVPKIHAAVTPIAKIPLVLFPAAAPLRDPTLAAPTPHAVLVQEE